MSRTIGPIWEANHMWLIIVIVILFTGFPEIYSIVSTYLHIPFADSCSWELLRRGTAFAFRHYDAVEDYMQRFIIKFSAIPVLSHLFFWALLQPARFQEPSIPDAKNFADAYIFSWLHFFSVAVGLFTVCICGYLAAIFLIGETETQAERRRYIVKARSMNIAAVISGALVFAAAAIRSCTTGQMVVWKSGRHFSDSAAVFLLILQWQLISQGKKIIIRLLAGFQVTMLLLATTFFHYPRIILLSGEKYLSLMEHHGDDKAIESLALALLIGSVFILPALFYLIYSFQKKNSGSEI